MDLNADKKKVLEIADIAREKFYEKVEDGFVLKYANFFEFIDKAPRDKTSTGNSIFNKLKNSVNSLCLILNVNSYNFDLEKPEVVNFKTDFKECGTGLKTLNDLKKELNKIDNYLGILPDSISSISRRNLKIENKKLNEKSKDFLFSDETRNLANIYRLMNTKFDSLRYKENEKGQVVEGFENFVYSAREFITAAYAHLGIDKSSNKGGRKL